MCFDAEDLLLLKVCRGEPCRDPADLTFVGFMLDNPLLTTVGSLIGVSGSILSYIMVRILSIRASNMYTNNM